MKLRDRILIGAVLAAFSSTALADECDGSESPTGWSIWCREAPLDPTAAGRFVSSGGSPVRGTDITDIFNPDTEDDRLPIALDDSDVIYYRAAYDFDKQTLHRFQRKWWGWKRIGDSDNGSTADAAGIGTTALQLDEGCCKYLPDPGDRIDGLHADKGGIVIATFEFDDFLGAYVNKDPLFHPHGYFLGGDDSQSGLEFIDGYEPIPLTIQDYWRGQHLIKTYYAYMQGQAVDGYRNDTSQKIGTEHRFVGGPLTPLADIQQLQTNQIMAGYSGSSAFHKQQVNVMVDFTGGKFGGSWRGGNPYNNVMPVSFDASGSLVGQHIVADSITGPGVTGGTLQGSFFGSQAGALGGAYEIQVDPGQMNGINGARVGVERPIVAEPYGFNDVFSTTKAGGPGQPD